MGKKQKSMEVKASRDRSTANTKVLEEPFNGFNRTRVNLERQGPSKPKSHQLLRSLAEIVEALEHTKSQLEARVADLSMVLEVSQILTEGLDINQVADFIAQRAMDYLQADSATLMLIENKKQLSIVAAKGLSAQISQDFKLSIGEGIAGWVVKTGEPIILDSEHPQDRDFLQSLNREKVKSCISVPLVYDCQTIGALSITNVISERHFSFDNLQVLLIISDIAALAIENLGLFKKSQRDFLNTVAALAAAIDAKDAYTRGHSERVANYAVAIADELKLPEEEKGSIETAALLHDIGKIGIPDGIMEKPAKLTDKEYKVVKMHPYTGLQIIQPIEVLAEVLPLVVAHHERYDGTGYLEGVKGKDIPLGARIIAVADAFEAMTSERAYRAALSIEDAMQELQKNVGTQFDPEIVQTFLKIIKRQKIRLGDKSYK